MKIEKKEQLANTYIVNDCPVKRDAYIELAEKLGCSLMGGQDSNFVKSCVEDGNYEYLFIEENGKLFARINRTDMKSPCGYGRKQIPADFKQLHLSDLIDLENSKVYTTDIEVVRKYSKLCKKQRVVCVNFCGAFNLASNQLVSTFKRNAGPDFESRLCVITADQVNALYDEKFGNVGAETPEEKEALDLIGQDAKNQLIHGALAISGRVGKEKLSDEKCRWPLTNLQCRCKSVPIVAEWDGNGLPPTSAKCEFEYPKGRWNAGYYHGETISEKVKMHILEFEGGELIKLGGLCNFRKPETEAERNERERLEAAYDLYQTLNNGKGCQFELFQSLEQAEWLAIVDKTGYRKG